MSGTPTSLAETQVTNIQRTGFWIIIDDKEYFIDFEDYSDFNKATVSQIHSFRRSKDGLHWDELDIDIEIDALKNPEKYPLKFKR